MDKSETAENGAKSSIAVSVYSTPENAVKLVFGGKFSAPMRDSNTPEISTTPTEAAGRGDRKVRTKINNGACRQGATSQSEVNLAFKGTSKLLTAECIQNWSETFVVADNGRQDFRSETLLVETKHFLEEGIHFITSEHSVVQTEQNLNYTTTEMRQKHRSLAFASSKQTSEELSELEEITTERTTALQHVEHGKLPNDKVLCH